MNESTIKTHTYSEEEIKQLSAEIASVQTLMPDDNDPALLIPPSEMQSEVFEVVDESGNTVTMEYMEGVESALEVSKTSMEIINDIDTGDIVKLLEILSLEFIEKNVLPIAGNKTKLAALATNILPSSILDEVNKLPASTQVDVKAHIMRQIASMSSDDESLSVDVFKELQSGMAKVTNASKEELGQIRKESIESTIGGLEKLYKKAEEKNDSKALQHIGNTIRAIKSGTSMQYLIDYVEKLHGEGRLKHVIKRGMRMEAKNLKKVYYRLESDKNFSFHRPEYLASTLSLIYKEKYAPYEINEFIILLWDLVMDGTTLNPATAYFTSAILSNVYHYRTPYFDTMRDDFNNGMERFFEVLNTYYMPNITE